MGHPQHPSLFCWNSGIMPISALPLIFTAPCATPSHIIVVALLTFRHTSTVKELPSMFTSLLFKIRIVGCGVQTVSSRHVGHKLAYSICPMWLWGWSIWWYEDWQGKLKYSVKTCPSATLSITNPTWPDPGSNPGLRGGKPATNRLTMARPMLKIHTFMCLLCCYVYHSTSVTGTFTVW
jgi:hypothetical protein